MGDERGQRNLFEQPEFAAPIRGHNFAARHERHFHLLQIAGIGFAHLAAAAGEKEMRRAAALIGVDDVIAERKPAYRLMPCLLAEFPLGRVERRLAGVDGAAGKGQRDMPRAMFLLPDDENAPVHRLGEDANEGHDVDLIEIRHLAPIRQRHALGPYFEPGRRGEQRFGAQFAPVFQFLSLAHWYPGDTAPCACR